MSESIEEEAKGELGPNTRMIEGKKNTKTLGKPRFKNPSQMQK